VPFNGVESFAKVKEYSHSWEVFFVGVEH